MIADIVLKFTDKLIGKEKTIACNSMNVVVSHPRLA